MGAAAATRDRDGDGDGEDNGRDDTGVMKASDPAVVVAAAVDDEAEGSTTSIGMRRRLGVGADEDVDGKGPEITSAGPFCSSQLGEDDCGPHRRTDFTSTRRCSISSTRFSSCFTASFAGSSFSALLKSANSHQCPVADDTRRDARTHLRLAQLLHRDPRLAAPEYRLDVPLAQLQHGRAVPFRVLVPARTRTPSASPSTACHTETTHLPSLRYAAARFSGYVGLAGSARTAAV